MKPKQNSVALLDTIAKALGTKLQEKFEDDPYAYVYVDIMEAFKEVINVIYDNLKESMKP